MLIAQLLYLESEDPDAPINMYINSPGGVVTAGLAIYDTMQYIQPVITTVCSGQGEHCHLRMWMFTATLPPN